MSQWFGVMCFRSLRRRGHRENSLKTKLHSGSSSFVCSENSGSCVFPTIYRRLTELWSGWCKCRAWILTFVRQSSELQPHGAQTVPWNRRVCTPRTRRSHGETQSMSTTTSLFSVPLVPGFSTASYLKVHIKTHHGSPLPPSSTMHTYPEPRGELQMHNGNPYHMGRQCSVEGKQPRPRPFPTLMRLAFQFASLLFRRHVLLHPVVCLTREHTSPSAAKLPAATASVRCLLQLTGCVFTLEEAV